MHRYIFRRLLIAIPTLVGITVLIFIAMRILPGDPLATIESETVGQILRRDADDGEGLRQFRDPTQRVGHDGFGRAQAVAQRLVGVAEGRAGLAGGKTITPDHLPHHIQAPAAPATLPMTPKLSKLDAPPPQPRTLRDIEMEHVLRVLELRSEEVGRVPGDVGEHERAAVGRGEPRVRLQVTRHPGGNVLAFRATSRVCAR